MLEGALRHDGERDPHHKLPSLKAGHARRGIETGDIPPIILGVESCLKAGHARRGIETGRSGRLSLPQAPRLKAGHARRGIEASTRAVCARGKHSRGLCVSAKVGSKGH